MDPTRLIFIVSPPRSGSTLLQRMLGSHSQIFSHPEPHLITPLYYLGYYDNVEKAPYDHINAAQALREFAQELPRGEEDYLDALRAYASTLYGRVLAPTGKGYFLDKTPAYALVLPFLVKLFPAARYVVLTRHPLAVMHSVAHSFFAGDYNAAARTNPIVERYVPPIAEFLLGSTPHVHVRYEDLVQDPKLTMTRVLQHVGLPFEPQTIDYGNQQHISKSYGDPVGVQRHVRPVTESIAIWARDLKARPDVLTLARQSIAGLSPVHLSAWGYPAEALFDELGSARPVKTRRSKLTRYQLQRRVVLALRQRVHDNVMGRALRKVRYFCDVLLRTP